MKASAEVAARRERNGVVWFAFPRLGEPDGVLAAVSSRHGGVSVDSFASLNLSFAVGDDVARVRENRRRFVEAAGFPDHRVVCAAQVHGNRIAYADERNAGAGYDRRETAIPDADGLITDRPGVALWLGFADCVPILAYDPGRRAVGLAHAGWRGTVGCIARELVESMEARLGSRRSDLRLVVGPSIGPCCYDVGPDVRSAFEQTWDDVDGLFLTGENGKQRLDLWEANRRLLIRAGVPDVNVLVSARCTACQVADFFSHRAQHGRAGRFAAVIALPEGG